MARHSPTAAPAGAKMDVGGGGFIPVIDDRGVFYAVDGWLDYFLTALSCWKIKHDVVVFYENRMMNLQGKLFMPRPFNLFYQAKSVLR